MASLKYANLFLSNKLLLPLLSVTLGVWGIGSLSVGYLLSAQMENSLEKNTTEVASLVRQNFVQREQLLQLKAKSIAEATEIADAVSQQDKSNLLRVLLPLQTSLDLDLLKVVDLESNTLLDLRGDTLSKANLEDPLIDHAAISGLTISTILHPKGESSAALIKLMSVKSVRGIAGGLIFGTAFDDELLLELQANAQQHLVLVEGQEVVASTLPAAKEISWQFSDAQNTMSDIDIAGEQYLAVDVDISEVIEAREKIVVLQPKGELAEAKQRLWLLTGGFGALGAGLIAAISIFVTRLIIRRVSKLTAATTTLAEGDFSTRVEIAGTDEVSRLAEGLNFMAEQVSNREQKIRTQVTQLERTLEELANAENKLVSQEKEYSRTLEAKVEERTEQLSEKNDQLAGTLKELQAVQQTMIAQEKLASLGSLTAGIAHEIKNPLNFVNNFAEIAVELVDDLTDDVDSQKEQVDAEFYEETADVLSSLKTLVSKIDHHGKRADSIVANMLQHSRNGSSEWKEVSINQIVAESVNLAYHGMRAKYSDFNLEFDNDYDTTIKAIEVSPQDISRVFLNIASNACYAIYQRQLGKEDGFKPLLKVRTRAQDGQIVVSIRDNGHGMTPEVKNKVFEQFFTTKPTGEGTGLGLSLSYNIVVEQHQGSMTVESEADVYTDFVVSLPQLRGE